MPKFETQTNPPRVLVIGEPASGKTGAVASLANAGYRILYYDFDQNSRVLGSYLKPGHADIFIETFSVAKLTNTNVFDGQGVATTQAVAELRRFTKLLQHWKTPTEDLGPVAKLTPKDVIVIDSGTFLGKLLLLAAHEDPKTKKDLRSLYQVAGEYYAAILDFLTGRKVGASVLVLTHLMRTGNKDEQGNITSDLRYIPVAIGEKASREMQTFFTDTWHLEVDAAGKRSFKTSATNKASLRTSRPDLIKGVEDFDLGNLFDRLTKA